MVHARLPGMPRVARWQSVRTFPPAMALSAHVCTLQALSTEVGKAGTFRSTTSSAMKPTLLETLGPGEREGLKARQFGFYHHVLVYDKGPRKRRHRTFVV